MSAMTSAILAPVGSTGNNNHAAVTGCESARTLAVEFLVEAAGATPTVTFKVQGALNRDATNLDGQPASDFWENLALVSSDASAATIAAGTGVTVTATGTSVVFVAGLDIRRWRKIRLVTSANTNITYSARLHKVEL